MKFTKMHGLGNDYVCINGFEEQIKHPAETAIWMCDRHYGVGADGLLLVLPSKVADFKMELYNADGTVARMCGNGIRCLGKYVFEHSMTTQEALWIETPAGLRQIYLYPSQNKVDNVRADMGKPNLEAHSIPILSERDIVWNEPLQVCQKEFRITGISMGNPHVVVFVEELKDFPMEQYGLGFEFHPIFPERTNVEFCHILNEHEIAVRVWERGVGETLSCGTGACAAAVAAILHNQTKQKVRVWLPGGVLEVEWMESTNHVHLTGEVKTVFEGEL